MRVAATAWSICALGLLLATPAAAQEPAAMPGFPAATGKPLLLTPPPAVLDPDALRRDCRAGPPCGWRIIGNVRKNGAVELNATALRW